MSAGESDAALAPYKALVRIAKLELELAGEGRYSEIAQLAAQHAQVMQALPATAPRAAREQLERALAMQRRVSVELLRRREQVLLSLRRIELAMRTAQGYGRTLPARQAERVYEKA